MQILGVTAHKYIVSQKVLAHNKFYWDVKPKDDKHLATLMKRCGRAEVLIKKFYHFIIKVYSQAERKERKGKRGLRWMKKYIKHKIGKMYGKDNDFYQQVADLPDDDRAFFEVVDREELLEFLKQKLIMPEKISE